MNTLRDKVASSDHSALLADIVEWGAKFADLALMQIEAKQKAKRANEIQDHKDKLTNELQSHQLIT